MATGSVAVDLDALKSALAKSRWAKLGHVAKAAGVETWRMRRRLERLDRLHGGTLLRRSSAKTNARYEVNLDELRRALTSEVDTETTTLAEVMSQLRVLEQHQEALRRAYHELRKRLD